MSACFYEGSTVILGVDLHPLDAEALEPHAVEADYGFPMLLGTLTTKVIADGEGMVQEGTSILMVPHIALPETGPGIVRLAATNLSSSSTAVLAVHSVIGQGSALACEIEGSLGLNVDCNAPVNAPTGTSMTLATVVTQPTAKDYAAAFGAGALSALWSWGSGKGFSKLGPLMSKWRGAEQRIAEGIWGQFSNYGQGISENFVQFPQKISKFVNTELE